MAKPKKTSHLRDFALSATQQLGVTTRVQCLIITRNGGHLSAVNGGGIGSAESAPVTALHTDATSPGALGIFTLVVLDKTHFALRTEDGRYVTATKGGGIGDTLSETGFHQPVVTDGTMSTTGSIFTMIPLNGKQVALLTSDGQHYVTAVNGGGVGGDSNAPIRTVAKKHGKDGRFELIVLAMQSKTVNGPSA
jgi:hypothetical protein